MQLFEFVDAAGTAHMVSIPHVQALLDERRMPAQPILTHALLQAVRHVRISPAWVRQVCLDVPLLAITLASLVDGHHRLARAVLEGRHTVEAAILAAEVS